METNQHTAYRIRTARPADAPAVQRIKAPYVECTPYNFAFEPPTAAEVERDIRQTLERYPFLVAEQPDGTLLGWAQAEPFRAREADGWNVELTIYLAEDARGHGVGTALYESLLRLLALQGVQNAYACITASNEASLAFHRARGFTEVGRFPATGYKQGAWHDTVYLWRALGDHEVPPAPFQPFAQLAGDAVL